MSTRWQSVNTNVTSASAGEVVPKCTTIATPGSEGDWALKIATETIAGKPGSRSRCEEFASVILVKLEAGLSAQRI